MTSYSTTEAAALLGISPRRVRALIYSGRLPATWDEETRTNRIDPAALESFEVKPRGRPRTQHKAPEPAPIEAAEPRS